MKSRTLMDVIAVTCACFFGLAGQSQLAAQHEQPQLRQTYYVVKALQKPKSTARYGDQIIDPDALDGPEPSISGYCAVSGGFLNGFCVGHFYPSCLSTFEPKVCPRNVKVPKPGILLCGQPLEVDYTRTCEVK